jgi:hypothetical protein
MNLFKKKAKEPSKFDFYRGLFITLEQAREWFPNQFVLLQDPQKVQGKTVGGVLLFIHPNIKKIAKFTNALPKPWANVLTLIDTRIYDQKNEDFAFL